jgi:plastocyanin
VKFIKPGTYKYFCDIHPGMIGYVVVKPQGKHVPSASQDAAALKLQVKAAEDSAKRLSKTKVTGARVSLGVAASNGVEDYSMFPGTLKVKAGTVVKFFMAKGSREAHTATFGPRPYLTTLAHSIQSPSPKQQVWYPSDIPSLGPPIVSPTVHGNGFANTGVLDQDPTTAQIPSSGKLKFTKAGTYHYICLIHPFMRGTIVVRH